MGSPYLHLQRPLLATECPTSSSSPVVTSWCSDPFCWHSASTVRVCLAHQSASFNVLYSYAVWEQVVSGSRPLRWKAQWNEQRVLLTLTPSGNTSRNDEYLFFCHHCQTCTFFNMYFQLLPQYSVYSYSAMYYFFAFLIFWTWYIIYICFIYSLRESIETLVHLVFFLTPGKETLQLCPGHV